MFTSNRMAGKTKNRKHRPLAFWLGFILAAAFLTYEIGIAAASLFYIHRLLQPGCDLSWKKKEGCESCVRSAAQEYPRHLLKFLKNVRIPTLKCGSSGMILAAFEPAGQCLRSLMYNHFNL